MAIEYITSNPVAPHVGAWIEIWEWQLLIQIPEVAPHVGAWIEMVWLHKERAKALSHPTWVRGLKFLPSLLFVPPTLSHPTWVRGLKLSIKSLVIRHSGVAPHVGAWIEIDGVLGAAVMSKSHPTWVRGLK